jgi:hypothetical protein
MKPEMGEDFMQKWNGVVKKKLTKKIDLERMYEEEIEERNPIHPASAVRNGNRDHSSNDGHFERVQELRKSSIDDRG